MILKHATIALLSLTLISCSFSKPDSPIKAFNKENTAQSVSNLVEDNLIAKTDNSKDDKYDRRTILASSKSNDKKLLIPDFEIYINQKDVRLDALIRSLAKIANIDIYVANDVNDYISISVEKVKWSDIFNYILTENNLTAVIDGVSGTITVKNKINGENDNFVVSALGNNFALSKEGTNSFSVPEVRTELFEIYNADPETVRNEIVSLLGYPTDTNKIKVSSVVQNSGARVNEFTSNADGVIESYKKTDQAIQRTPGLIITGTVSQLDKIEKAIDSLDRRIPQVFIEAFIVTVTDDFERALGSRLSLLDNAQNSSTQGSLATTFNTNTGDTADNLTALTNFGIAGLTATTGFNVLTTIGVDRLRLGLEAMERDGLARSVANPKIMVINQEKGYFFQGSVLCWTFEAGGSTTTTDGGNVNAVTADKVTQCTDGTSSHADYPAPEGKELGLKLEVVPTINFSNQLMLDLNVQQTTATATSATAPPATTKLSLANRLMTNSGDIIVIGGNHALSESFVRRNIPGLGENAFTSFLAGGKEQDDQFKEMLIFLSARKM